ncbi:unnamed protein product [Caenorhabditis bovis]|uniref:BTB domain-containing protein n=1 Tax=Caenorhabditis bovis TaxID=2654633 RepID=A0A8S1FBP8_9PELO|nr:unnamed protein product [Caenorhabditis bovis]
MRFKKSSSESSDETQFREKDEWEWAQKLARRLEQVLNVHPEKYQNGFNSQRASRQSSPDHVPERSRSADYGRAVEMANGDEVKGMLLSNGDEVMRHQSPQRGTPNSSIGRGAPESIVTINVAGMRFQTFESTLARYPNSLLGDPTKRRHFYIPETNEYFFDRHRTTNAAVSYETRQYLFESILYIYQSNGRVKRPEIVPIDVFLREMRFYEMGDELLEEFWISEGYEKPKEVLMPKNKTQRKIWELMEFPDSSLSARIVAFISIFVIALSIISFCWETVPSDNEKNATAIYLEDAEPKTYTPFFWIELSCILWFTLELTLRFISCPCKVSFCTSLLNIIDFVAIAPFFVNFFLYSNSSMSFAVLRVLRLVRVFRVFKLSRHSVGLQILGKTFRSSIQEFCLLIFFLAIANVLFASGMYFAEQGEPNSKFTSIPASFWFVLVTMTTVGYGDLVPLSPFGKLVGGLCALIGVLTLALPVPIIVANFKHFYRQENRLASMKNSSKDDDDAA